MLGDNERYTNVYISYTALRSPQEKDDALGIYLDQLIFSRWFSFSALPAKGVDKIPDRDLYCKKLDRTCNQLIGFEDLSLRAAEMLQDIFAF